MNINNIRTKLEELKKAYWLIINLPVEQLTTKLINRRNQLDKMITDLEVQEAQLS